MKSGHAAGIYAALEHGQVRLKENLADLTPEQLLAVPSGFTNSIATLVMHVAAVEVNMAHRFLGKSVRDELKAEYLLDQPQSPLPVARGETVESLTAKMAKARNMLQEAMATLVDADLDKEWEAPSGRRNSFRYLLNLLPHHQGAHLGHIQFTKRLI